MGEFLVVGRYITYLELMFKFYQSLSKFHKKKRHVDDKVYILSYILFWHFWEPKLT